MAQTAKSNRGFASMDAAKQREIASKGGRAAHQQGTAHEFTSEEARVAGRKGGLSVSRDRAHMSQIGREGGTARAFRRATQMRAVPPESIPFSQSAPEAPKSEAPVSGQTPTGGSDEGMPNQTP